MPVWNFSECETSEAFAIWPEARPRKYFSGQTRRFKGFLGLRDLLVRAQMVSLSTVRSYVVVDSAEHSAFRSCQPGSLGLPN